MRWTWGAGLAGALSLLSSAAAHAQAPAEEDEAVGQSINYVFATDLGSGLYEMDGRSLQVYRYAWRKELRPVDKDAAGIRFVLPVTAGFFDFNPVDVISEGPPTRVDSFSVVPGVEFDYPLPGDWHVLPYARVGLSFASSSVGGVMPTASHADFLNAPSVRFRTICLWISGVYFVSGRPRRLVALLSFVI